MAEIKITLAGIHGEELKVNELLSFELSRSIDAPCDGLRITYLCGEEPFEISEVTVHIGGEKVFYGICDRQKMTSNEKGFEVFVYARSSAAVLLDNEAVPITYNAPCTDILFHNEAKRFGFKNKLPDFYCGEEYAVTKGISCYGAINNFVQFMCNKNIAVSPEGELFLPDGKGKIALDNEKIISEERCINRALPFCKIDFKLKNDSTYARHRESEFLKEQKIIRSRKVNISSLPEWQRSGALSSMLTSSVSEYSLAKITIDGCRNFSLYDLAVYNKSEFGTLDGFSLSKITITQNSFGKQTELTFSKEFDLKEVTYVAE